MRFLLGLALLVGLTPAAPVPKAKKPPDAEQLVGTWKVTAVNGKAENAVSQTFIFDGEGGGKSIYGTDSVATLTWTLQPDESPKQMKLTTKQDAFTKCYACAYELDGDTLGIAFPTKGQKAPAKVEVGPNVVLWEMNREPAK